jgi:hypothetical protein
MRRVWVAILLVVSACSTGGAQPVAQPVAHRVVATPEATGRASVTVTIAEPTSPPQATRSGAVDTPNASTAKAAAPLAALPPAPVVGMTAFRGLGAWLDVFDHTNDPASVVPLVRSMHAKGTKTLYLESARYSTNGDFEYPTAMGAALDEAKKLGMRVVAWYPPDFTNLKADLQRSTAAIRYRSPAGNRFDAFGADIEYTAGVPDHAKRNELVVDYSKKLRQAAGKTYPLAAIVIPPSWLERSPQRWPDFPWKAIGSSYDLVMPMEYWTAIGKDPGTAYDLTKTDVEKTRALTGRPVHIIGGLGADADGPQTSSYVKAVKASGSIGGGLYDFRTTRDDVWDELRELD